MQSPSDRELAVDSPGTSRIGRYLGAKGLSTYDELWRYSIAPETTGEFWNEIQEMAKVHWHRAPTATVEVAPESVTGVRWFPGGRLNYAESMLAGDRRSPDATAVIGLSQSRPRSELSRTELLHLVAGIRTGLVNAGVTIGDRVAGYLPNIPEALAAMLATASIGAIWSCCSPEMGTSAVLERLAQIEPKVLLSTDGYRYGGRSFDRTAEAEQIRASLPTLECGVWLNYLDATAPVPLEWVSFESFTKEIDEISYTPVPFDHPLYILFSSGTTGRPKAIVHGHGGILLEHFKALSLHFDLGESDRFLWQTTTGWMMWNFLVSGLLVGATVVLLDGNPAWPKEDSLWEIIEEESITCAGVGSAYLVSCMRKGMVPKESRDLGKLRALGATGSPLPSAAAIWVEECVSESLMLGSFSGGTDVCTGFAGPSPLHKGRPGELSCRCLGASLEVFDDDGHPIVGEEGELVLTAAMPSMPVAFWADPESRRYRDTYYGRYRGIWAHGDRATLTDRGSLTITGRSDGTLNRGGVRLGTSDFYNVVEALPGIDDSLVVHIDDPEGGPGELWLFVVAPKLGNDEELARAVRDALRRHQSARHVPDHVISVPAIPRTLSGKKLEVPVKRILSGADPMGSGAAESVADAATLAPFIALAHRDSDSH